MIPSLRSLLAAALVAALATPAFGQPVKVQLPKAGPGAPERPPREPPPEVAPEEQTKAPDRKRMSARGLFQLDFDKVDIDKLVQTISDMTGKLFILPENVRGKISIIGPEHGKAGVSADEAYAAFLAALDANGLTLYPVGKFLKIVEKRAGKQSNIPTMMEEGAPYTTNEQMVTKLFRLRYVEAEPVRAVIQQLVSRDGDTIAFPPDVIIVNDIGLNMHRLEKIITRLDSATSSDEIRIIQVQYAAATDIAEKLRQVFEDKNKRPGQRAGQASVAPPPAVPGAPTQPPAAAAPAGAGTGEGDSPANLSQLIADERTNKLIIVANAKAFQRIDQLLRHLDAPVPGEGQVHVYYLENANAEELANTLASLTQGVGARGARPATPAAAPGQPRPPATVADLFSGEIKITADKGTNSLVIIANNNDYRSLVNVIERLDIARRQVFVEAVIMEVNLRNSLDLGISVHGGSPASLKSTDDSALVIGNQGSTVKSLSGILSLASLTGFLAGLQGPAISDKFPIPSFSIVMQALQKSSDVNVLSTPHILTSDNEEAEITVGQNIPFQAGYTPSALGGLGGLGSLTGQTGAASSLLGGLGGLGGLSSYIAPIQRQNVELKLKIKPQINESDFIRLLIEEQTEEISDRDPALGPTTAKRSAKTTVVAKDQQTVVIGGLIQERVTEGVQKVPILGDIPVIGRLFRHSSTEKTKTNLLLFLTPYIIRDQSDFRRIFERKLKERQEFVEQFYGRQPGYNVPVDYRRKAGPLAKMLRTLDKEARKAENGGLGGPEERLIQPETPPATPGASGEGAAMPPAGGAAEPAAPGTSPERAAPAPIGPEVGEPARPPEGGPAAPVPAPAPGEEPAGGPPPSEEP